MILRLLETRINSVWICEKIRRFPKHNLSPLLVRNRKYKDYRTKFSVKSLVTYRFLCNRDLKTTLSALSLWMIDRWIPSRAQSRTSWLASVYYSSSFSWSWWSFNNFVQSLHHPNTVWCDPVLSTTGVSQGATKNIKKPQRFVIF